MKTLFAILVLFGHSQYAAASDIDPCAQFASHFAINTVTTSIILEGVGGVGGAIYEHNFFPDTPSLEKEETVDGHIVKTFDSVITVVPKSDITVATRYNVTLEVIDHDASCSMVDGSATVDLEN